MKKALIVCSLAILATGCAGTRPIQITLQPPSQEFMRSLDVQTHRYQINGNYYTCTTVNGNTDCR